MAKESTFRVLVAGCQGLLEVYQKLHLREGMTVVLTPKKANSTIDVESKKGLVFWGRSEYLGDLMRSEALLFQLDRGYKIKDPQFAGYHDHDWGKELILQIKVVKPSDHDFVPIVSCAHCHRLNVKAVLFCRGCQEKLSTSALRKFRFDRMELVN